MDAQSFSTPLMGHSHDGFTPPNKRVTTRVTGGIHDPYTSTPKSNMAAGSANLSSFSVSSLPLHQSSIATFHNRPSPPSGPLAPKSSPSLGPGSGAGPGRTSMSPVHGGRGGSPTRAYGSSSSSSPLRHGYVSELENATIQKQRKELQLLMGELQDRDRELNEIVASHQKQLLAWEQDSQSLLMLEQRYARLQGELKSQSEQLKSQLTKTKVLESQEQSKDLSLQSTQKQLEQMSERAAAATRQTKEMEEHNIHLNEIIRDLSSKVGQFEAREQELMTMLKLKDNDLAEASAHITDMSSKLKRMDQANKELRRAEATTGKELAVSKQKCNEAKKDLEKLTSQLNTQNNANTEQSIELGQLQLELQALQQERGLAAEREKRKDQLLELQRSKQDRVDAELTNLRQVYERQQRDLSQLQQDSRSDAFLRPPLNTSLHDDNSHSHNDSKSPPNASGKSHTSSSLHDNSPLEGVLTEDHNGQGGPYLSSGDTEELLTADSSGEFQGGEASPTSKLHRLLTESRQMVQNLEQTTLPPYLSKEAKQDDFSITSIAGCHD